MIGLLVLSVAAHGVQAIANLTAQGGNITKVGFNATRQTDHWQGVAGQVFFSTAPATTNVNATGSFVNGTNINFTIDCDDPISASGFIAFSNSSTPPTGLVAGNLAILDMLTGNKSDSGTRTFTTTSTFALPSGSVSGVPTTFPFVNQSPQSSTFRVGYFNDAIGSIVFIAEIFANLLGYNESFFDYESLLVAPNKTTKAYFIFADITFTCPAVVSGGVVLAAPACVVFWRCDPWGPCQPNGLQYRKCWPHSICPNVTTFLKPPLVRTCIPKLREERPEIISEREILIGNLTLNLTPDHAYILEPKEMHGTFQNWNDFSLEDITYTITTPRIYTAFALAHPGWMLWWNTLLGGWTDHGQAEARALDWIVIPPEPLERLNPHSIEPYAFTLVPPVMHPKVVDIGVSTYSGPVRVKSTIAPLIVDVHPFQIAGEWRKSQNILVLYFVVDNRGRKEKSINIEVALNQGRSTLIGELLGPLRVPAGRVMIYGHEYRMSPRMRNRDVVIDARLRAPDGDHRATARFTTR